MDDHLEESTVESVRVYEGAFLKVRRDRARLPDGSVHGRRT